MDQFLMTPVLLVIFFTGNIFTFTLVYIYTSINNNSFRIEGMSLMERVKDPFEECRQKFLSTFGRSCLFWLPAQSLNFLLIPPKFRVIYVGTCALIWVNILCWVKRQNVPQPTEHNNKAIKEN